MAVKQKKNKIINQRVMFWIISDLFSDVKQYIFAYCHGHSCILLIFDGRLADSS
jgi:hypothetical protein